MVDKARKFIDKESYTFDDLVEIMRILRAPDGCPWDREQDHKSIRQNFIEETYEAIEAIDNSDSVLLCEELGDVLMQVVFHSVISEEQREFSVSDVIKGVCSKLVLRHPHIFSNEIAENTEKVLDNWDKIKTAEKRYNSTGEKIDSISRAMPSLMRAQRIGGKCRKAGFDFADANDALEKLGEEANELMTEYERADKEKTYEEAGDLLLAAVNVVRLCDVDAERALYDACEKYISRYKAMEKIMSDRGLSLENMSDDEKNSCWNDAKNCTKQCDF